MIKIFDHDGNTDQWEEIPADKLESVLADRFDTSYWYDKDNSFDHYIEVWNSETNEIVVHHASHGSWLYNDDPEGPYTSRDYGSLADYARSDRFRPTKLNPTKDYIIV